METKNFIRVIFIFRSSAAPSWARLLIGQADYCANEVRLAWLGPVAFKDGPMTAWLSVSGLACMIWLWFHFKILAHSVKVFYRNQSHLLHGEVLVALKHLASCHNFCTIRPLVWLPLPWGVLFLCRSFIICCMVSRAGIILEKSMLLKGGIFALECSMSSTII